MTSSPAAAVVRPAVCPDPDRHRMWDAANDTTIRRRAEHLPAPVTPGRCGYCDGALPTAGAAA